LDKLTQCGVVGDGHEWFKSYLNDRPQLVNHSGQLEPQGSTFNDNIIDYYVAEWVVTSTTISKTLGLFAHLFSMGNIFLCV